MKITELIQRGENAFKNYQIGLRLEHSLKLGFSAKWCTPGMRSDLAIRATNPVPIIIRSGILVWDFMDGINPM